MLDAVRANARFSAVPADVQIQRSGMDRNSTVKTTANVGDLVPFYIDEVLPGDTMNVDTSFLARMSTPIYPVMDDAYIDIFYFFVPARLVYDDAKYLFGEPRDAWFTPTPTYVPQVQLTPALGSVADHFGLPLGKSMSVNAMPFRAYDLIYNEWFRDENLSDPVVIDKGFTLNDEMVSQTLHKVSKFKDYFTSALPSPQRGPDVLLPFGNDFMVTTSATANNVSSAPLRFNVIGSGGSGLSTAGKPLVAIGDQAANSEGGYDRGYLSYDETDSNGSSWSPGLSPSNLVVSGDGLEVTINQLRQAIQIQRMYERDARGGARYRELVKSHFGVTIPDTTAMIPELLCQSTERVNVNQVVQQSATDDVSPQGNVAAFSKTVHQSRSFNKSFVEHGYLIGLFCIRTNHTYQQGIERLWTRQDRFDFYWPALAHLGEQPILNKEIYYQNNAEDEEVFGYQEAYAEYRYKRSYVTGAFRSGISGSLDAWHYGDYYGSRPSLSAEFMYEPDTNVDRTLAVTSDLADQFILDFYIANNSVRPMPLYSVPGLMDHL